jgi:23S rRNA G2069 N7-methylase RlmK/C1962 C5-methylase RlmI
VSSISSSSSRAVADTSTATTNQTSAPLPTSHQGTFKNDDEQPSSLLPVVVLKRNKQSRSFRDGNQLVFGGAIAMAYATPLHEPNVNQRNNNKKAMNTARIDMGALVRVEVLLQADTELQGNATSSKSSPSFQNKNTKGRGNNKNKKPTDTSQNYDYPILDHPISTAASTTTTTTKPTPATTQTIGWGVYNPHSLYRVRLLCHSLLEPKLHQQLLTQSKDGSSCSTSNDMVSLVVRQKLHAALRLRQQSLRLLLDNDNSNHLITDTFRWVNGEGDGLSGLAVDILGYQVAVIMSSAAWCQVYQTEIEQAVQDVWNNSHHPKDDHHQDSPIRIVWKTTPGRLEQDGFSSASGGGSNNKANMDQRMHPAAKEEGEDVAILDMEHDEAEVKMQDDDDCDGFDLATVEKEEEEEEHTPTSTTPTVSTADGSDTIVICREYGILYETKPFQRLGQKTGIYCDQRDNRIMIQEYCRNKRVLDLCCYHGGFALHALIHGQAKHVTGVDSSQDAIDTCWRNVKLNGISQSSDDNSTIANRIQFVRDDISKFCQTHSDTFYDVVILDPPKLAPSMASLDRAQRKYASLNRDAIQRIDPTQGGLLLTCTCSAAMTQHLGGRTFLETIQQAATMAGRQVTLLRVSGAASCHTQSPACFPAGDYLTAALFHIHPKQ